MQILFDGDLPRCLPMEAAVRAVRAFFASAAAGGVVSPPRHSLDLDNGGLTFTIGAETRISKTLGFRVYDTFPHDTGTNTEQIVAVYDSDSGQLKGVVIGGLLGAIRTAAICGLAMDHMAPKDMQTLAVIGAGHQAYFQVAAALAVRHVDRILVCGRSAANAKHLSERVQRDFGIPASVSLNVEHSVRAADAVLCATNSTSPVIQKGWLKENAFVSSIGPKFVTGHELPADIGDGNSILVSDALTQLSSYTTPYFLPDIDGVIPLENLIEHPLNPPRACHRIFLCAGRSGTEVAVANQALSKGQEPSPHTRSQP